MPASMNETDLLDIKTSVYAQLRSDFKKDLADLIKDEVATVVSNNLAGINNIVHNLQNAVENHDEILENMPQLIDTKVEAKYKTNESQLKDMANKMSRLENRIATLETYQDELQEQVEHNTGRIENSEKSDRLDTVIIEGLIMDKEKSLKNNVCDEILECINFTIKPTELKHVSRFCTDEYGNIVAVKVKFHDPDLKNDLVRQRGKLRGTQVYIDEFLSLGQKTIYDEARLLVQQNLS